MATACTGRLRRPPGETKAQPVPAPCMCFNRPVLISFPMEDSSIVYILFLIFCGAALLATLAMAVRQSLIIAYIGLGLLIGPWGINLISDIGLIQNIASVGIVFLLFLLGLNLHPQELIRLAGEATIVTGVSSAGAAWTRFRLQPDVWLQHDRGVDRRRRVDVLQHHYRPQADSDYGPASPAYRRNHHQRTVAAGYHRHIPAVADRGQRRHGSRAGRLC